jgi:hypothetical protein
MALTDIDAIERRIITAYLDRVEKLAAERPTLQIRVFDGEETSYLGAFDRAGIEKVVGITEETRVYVRVGDESHVTVFLHGNYEDVISDSAANAAGEWLEDHLLKGLAA